ncbi:CCR4-NOT core subunit NOT5 NDAI_0A05080 [Naumovozyma dairenensis CBS 421]|uniref:General negative regulator of transcription subunit n=1 Tax=Naumovozyma dairenensis (strain ATCC 10597 / BCRC 20456 / CBS 421 / NBRC 0211 / NRRL Y-12639) TaxID=1071378 RepID=G0W4C5_NAUDC|nr:hypothetical protein NDAI_0A05080 [Naumovozyma dairenensis CBS 421]CCD22663.1 hypothetical protein NDAI_0A05080 [Naumovozyma dairenensis CBS 421]
MSQRKLQQDIDKLLKKVREGLEDFEIIYEKFQSTEPSNSSYREKLEADLKREIKKLQKHREQIKTWLSKDDVKDKTSILMENRRLIENGMERFKAVEKLMKTKQFSKEALTNPDIITDPKELKKRDRLNFIEECLEELQKQLESHEAQDDQEQVERHEFHISNLENILKLVQNGDMEPETVDEYEEDIKYYVENNEDPDFVEYDTIYEDMGCEVDPDASTSIINNATTSAVPEKQDRTPKKVQPIKRVLKSTPNVMLPSPTVSTPVSASPSPAPSSLSNKKQTAESDNTFTKDTKDTKDTKETSSEVTKTIDANTANVEEMKKTTDTEDIDGRLKLKYPPDRTEEIEEIIKHDVENNKAFQNPLFKNELEFWINTKKQLLQPYKEMPNKMVSQLESSLLNCPDSLDADSPYLYQIPLSLPHPTSIFFPNEPIRFVYPFDINTPVENNINNNDNSANAISDTENLNKKHYEDMYSRTSLAKIYTKFDLDTLFFIFYHYQGTYDQFLASRELSKNRDWKYNKVDYCWYYKEIEKLPPGANYNKDEEESWRYFDYKKSWLSRRCGNDFVYKEEDFEKL